MVSSERAETDAKLSDSAKYHPTIERLLAGEIYSVEQKCSLSILSVGVEEALSGSDRNNSSAALNIRYKGNHGQ